jgi:mono/diheme cytochrome c family protein
MRTALLGAILAIAGMVWLPNTGFSQQKGDGPPVTEGQYWYLNYCASCHGASGKGDGIVGKALSPKPADLTTLSVANGGTFPAPEVNEIIDGRRVMSAHGSREMPVWGRATRFAPVMVRARIRAIVDYVATLQGK